MPRLHFFSLPLQAKTTYTIFSFPNEILHKLTSCHFILQNKTLNDLYLKTLLFSPPRAKNCTIHRRTVTQTHDLSCHQFSLKSPFLRNLFSKSNFFSFTFFFFQNFKLYFPNFTFEKQTRNDEYK